MPTAKIITGDALPILTSIQLSGVNGVSQQVQYVNVGVTLQIAPRVSADQRAQKLFEQGMVFGLGFNFAEAVRSFRAATLADLDCAMCRWGIAWALGPSVNHDMKREDVPIAIDAIVQARAYAPDPASRERALIEALARRSRRDRAVSQRQGRLRPRPPVGAAASAHLQAPGRTDCRTHAARPGAGSTAGYWPA